VAGSEHDEEHSAQRRRFALLRREWELSLYPQVAEAGSCLVTMRFGQAAAGDPDPERSQAEGARRALTKIRRYGAAKHIRHTRMPECAGMSLDGPSDSSLPSGGDKAATSAGPQAKSMNFVGRDRAPEPLQLQLADRRSIERVFRRREDALADQDLPTSRNRAQPGGKARDRA
jgi:hypothetical protein